MNVIYKIDGIDLRNYGVHVSASEGLLSRPRPKKPTTVNWKDYNGEVVDLAKRTYEARDIELDCFIEAGSQMEFQEKVVAFLSAFDTANTKRLQVGVESLSGNENLLVNSAHLLMGPNDIGLGASVLMTDEDDKYQRATPASNSAVSLGGAEYSYTESDIDYIISAMVRLQGVSGEVGKAYLYVSSDVSDSAYMNENIPYNTWVKVRTNSFRLPLSTSPNPSYLILANESDNKVGKYLDYKKLKIEKSSVPTEWCPATLDLKPLVFEVYSSEGIDIKKTWNERTMVGTFKLKLNEPEPIKKVIKYTRTGEGDKTVSITLTSSKLLNIYWGDGTHTYDVSGTVTVTHDFTTNGTFYIVVTGNIDEITSLTTTGTVVWTKL